MSNPSKAKGTRWETAVVNWLGERQIYARRETLHGNSDHGDIHLPEHVVILEAKWRPSVPTVGELDTWLDEAKVEAHNVTVDRFPRERATYYGALVHNRPRVSSPADAVWYLWSFREEGWLRMDGYQFVDRIEDYTK